MDSRLARRQVRWVLLAALVLGFLLSSVQIYWEYSAREAKLEQDLNLLLRSVQESAAAAAYQLSADLAHAVCDGLIAHPNLNGCSLMLDNDYRLVETTQSPPPLYLGAARPLFGGPRVRELALVFRSEVYVGTLRVDIDPSAATNDFLVSALVVVGVGMVRALLLAVVLFSVFYALVTRPVVRLSTNLFRIDPTGDSTALEEWQPRRTEDEIRDLETLIRQMLHQTRDHVQALGRAQIELKEINRSLESRVEERTRALERAVKKLETQARTDPLTQLYNRRHFYREAERFLGNWKRYEEAFAVLVLDLDRFKTINDRFGHDIGDRVLENLAAVLKEQCREGDLVARMGGEEFIVLIKVMEPDEAGKVAERIREAVAGQRLEAVPDRVTVSIGVARVRPGEKSLNTLIKRADQAMYRAKAGGRNRVEEDRPQTSPIG